jgi:hypothetical protein
MNREKALELLHRGKAGIMEWNERRLEFRTINEGVELEIVDLTGVDLCGADLGRT